MRNKLTTDYILEMLKEVKSLCDTNSFDFAKFIKSHPHFNSILKIIQDKGIFNKSKKEFTNIEPNEIMAKEIFRLFSEERKEFLENKKMDSITKEEYKINSEKLTSRVQSLELELLHLKTDYKDFKELAHFSKTFLKDFGLNSNANKRSLDCQYFFLKIKFLV